MSYSSDFLLKKLLSLFDVNPSYSLLWTHDSDVCDALKGQGDDAELIHQALVRVKRSMDVDKLSRHQP